MSTSLVLLVPSDLHFPAADKARIPAPDVAYILAVVEIVAKKVLLVGIVVTVVSVVVEVIVVEVGLFCCCRGC